MVENDKQFKYIYQAMRSYHKNAMKEELDYNQWKYGFYKKLGGVEDIFVKNSNPEQFKSLNESCLKIIEHEIQESECDFDVIMNITP